MKVSDESTSLLMAESYKNLKDTDKSTALRLAQSKVKDMYNSHFFRGSISTHWFEAMMLMEAS